MTVGRPARFAAAAGLAGDLGQSRPVRFDDPDLVIAYERDAAPVGRPLRIRGGLLGCGDLARIASAQREREDLACPGRFGGEGDDPVARMKPEFARRSPRSRGSAMASWVPWASAMHHDASGHRPPVRGSAGGPTDASS
jgi:hypothetical protein